MIENQGFTDIDLVQNGVSNNNHVGENADVLQKTKVRKPTGILQKIRNTMIKGLEKIFYKIGFTIARHPYTTIVVSIIVPLLLFIGMKDFQFDEDFANLLLPPSSRIREDRKWVEDHVPFEQRPIRLVLKSKNVLTRDSLLALYDFHHQLTELRVEGNQTFETLCVRIGSRCFVDSLLALWRNNNETISKLTDQDIVDSVNTVKTNPTYFFAFNATRMLSDITRNSTNHIVTAGVMHADWFIQSSKQLTPVAKQLEDRATELALAGHDQFDMITIFTMDAYFEEFFKGVYGDVVLIGYGFPFVLLYIILAMGKCNLVDHGLYLTFAAIVGVGLSAGACFGLGLAAGFLFGAPHQALIFLLLAVGVDDAFVIVKTWERINDAHKDMSIEERVGRTMQHAGVSVTVTSFSDLVAFACGISTQMPVLRSFCVFCSIGIFFLFLMQSTLFPACLTLNQRRVEASRDGLVPCVVHSKKESVRCRGEFIAPFFKNIFAPMILSIPGKVIIIVLTLGIAGVMFYGVTLIEKGFEFEKSLPEDSFIRHFLESQRLYFPNEGPGIQVFCTPMNYQKNLNALDGMAKEYAASSVVMYGLVANWIPLFKLYCTLFAKAKGMTLNDDGIPADSDDFHNLLKDFFETPLGLPFSKYIEMTDTKPPEIKWTYFPMQQIVSQEVWQNEFIMEEVRRIADNTTLEGGRCFVYSVFHIFTEVIRYIDSEIMRNFILAGVAIFIVTLLLIVDFVTSFFVLVCVGLTTLNIMGSLSYWGFYLDVNVVVLLIITIGLAVDFSAHVGYTFMTLTGSRNERTTNTLCQIGPAILHGAVTTFLVFFVLIFGKSLSLFFAVFILVVLYGLFHGLCFLPVVLSIIGPAPYYNAGPQGTDTADDAGNAKHTNQPTSAEAICNQTNHTVEDDRRRELKDTNEKYEQKTEVGDVNSSIKDTKSETKTNGAKSETNGVKYGIKDTQSEVNLTKSEVNDVKSELKYANSEVYQDTVEAGEKNKSERKPGQFDNVTDLYDTVDSVHNSRGGDDTMPGYVHTKL